MSFFGIFRLSFEKSDNYLNFKKKPESTRRKMQNKTYMYIVENIKFIDTHYETGDKLDDTSFPSCFFSSYKYLLYWPTMYIYCK